MKISYTYLHSSYKLFIGKTWEYYWYKLLSIIKRPVSIAFILYIKCILHKYKGNGLLRCHRWESVILINAPHGWQLSDEGEGHFGAADSALDNSAPCRFGAGHFGAVSYFFYIFRVMKKMQWSRQFLECRWARTCWN